MYTLIRSTLFILFVVYASAGAFAGSGKYTPAHLHLRNLYTAAHRADSFLAAQIKTEKISKTGAKICSCQILNLGSNNYDHRHIAVFAEITNHGSEGDRKYAGQRIEKEKKQLKKLFYNKIRVVQETTAMTTCAALFIQLKSADERLQLYDVLNADINF